MTRSVMNRYVDTTRFPSLSGNPNRERIIFILDHDPQIIMYKNGEGLEGDDNIEDILQDGPDDYATFLLDIIENSNDPDVDEDDYLGQVTFQGDSFEKEQRLITLYHNIKPLL